MFIRVLPWPTALRVIDAVVSEGRLACLLRVESMLISRRLAISARRGPDDSYAVAGPHFGPQVEDEILRFLNDLPQDRCSCQRRS